jgi:flagellar biosynthesis protein FlhG
MTNPRWQSSGAPKVLSVLSGKGGVGKSIIAFNLADQLAAKGNRVLLVDADFACGNLHILSNAPARSGVNEYLTAQLSLQDAITPVCSGVSLLAANWNDDLADHRDVIVTAKFVNALREDAADQFDLIIMDHASGRSKQAAALAHASDLNLMVVIPELTSLTDAYGLFKFLAELNRNFPCGLVINRTQSEEEVSYIRNRFPELARRFLGTQPLFFGAITEHESVRRSVAAQASLSFVAADAAPARELAAIANVLSDMLLGAPSGSRTNPFSQINKSSATADIRG